MFRYYRTPCPLTGGAISTMAVLAAIFANDETKTPQGKRRTFAEEALVPSSLDGLAPASPIYIYRPNPNLEIAFDTRTRNPVYVMERLVTGTKDINSNRKQKPAAQRLKRPNFYEEKSLPEEFRSRQSHYRNSGYDRGHLAAAANYMDRTQEELGQTFNLMNVSPQNHSMNSSIWNQLERWTKKVAEEHSDNHHYQATETFVITGPLWMPSRQSGDKLFEFHFNAIGIPPSLVSVPTHFFKIVVVIQYNRIWKYACFVVPNAEQLAKYPLEQYLVPWSNLEAVTGLHFFPRLTSEPSWKQQANQLTLELVPSSSNRITSSPSSQPLLLLTDGSENKRKWKWTGRHSSNQLEHLCANGKCR